MINSELPAAMKPQEIGYIFMVNTPLLAAWSERREGIGYVYMVNNP
jgi:hypothetical protein